MLKRITAFLITTQLIFVSSAFATPIMQFKDLEVHKDNAEQFRFVSGKEQVVVKRVSAQHIMLNGKSVKWDKNTTMTQLKAKTKKAYMASKKKNALLERLLINEAHAIPFIFPLVLGGMIGAAATSAFSDCDDGGRSTSSVKKKK